MLSSGDRRTKNGRNGRGMYTLRACGGDYAVVAVFSIYGMKWNWTIPPDSFTPPTTDGLEEISRWYLLWVAPTVESDHLPYTYCKPDHGSGWRRPMFVWGRGPYSKGDVEPKVDLVP